MTTKNNLENLILGSVMLNAMQPDNYNTILDNIKEQKRSASYDNHTKFVNSINRRNRSYKSKKRGKK